LAHLLLRVQAIDGVLCSYFTLGNCRDLKAKYHKFSLKLLIFPMLQYYDINCKTVIILFYLLITQLTV